MVRRQARRKVAATLAVPVGSSAVLELRSNGLRSSGTHSLSAGQRRVMFPTVVLVERCPEPFCRFILGE